MTIEQIQKRNLKIKIKQNKNALSVLDAKKQERLDLIAELEEQLQLMEGNHNDWGTVQQRVFR